VEHIAHEHDSSIVKIVGQVHIYASPPADENLLVREIALSQSFRFAAANRASSFVELVLT
jgi:hypothetical protein